MLGRYLFVCTVLFFVVVILVYLKFCIWLCMYVYEYDVCVWCMCMCVQACVHGGQVKILGVLLCHSLPYSFETESLDPGASLATSQPQWSSCLCPDSTGVTYKHEAIPSFFIWPPGSELRSLCLLSKCSHPQSIFGSPWGLRASLILRDQWKISLWNISLFCFVLLFYVLKIEPRACHRTNTSSTTGLYSKAFKNDLIDNFLVGILKQCENIRFFFGEEKGERERLCVCIITSYQIWI